MRDNKESRHDEKRQHERHNKPHPRGGRRRVECQSRHSEAADESKTEIVAASEASDSRTTLQSEAEDTCVHWIKRFIFFHDKRHPGEMAETEIARFLSNLATESHVAHQRKTSIERYLVSLP